MKPRHTAIRPVILFLPGWVAACGGCTQLRTDNTAVWVRDVPRARRESPDAFAAKAGFWYPLRDVVTAEPILRQWGNEKAWNVNDRGGVDDSSFYTNRRADSLAPDCLRRRPNDTVPPEAPFAIVKRKQGGATRGFVGRDATGRTFQVKLDHPDYPELGTAAEVIGSRLMWLLGYHVPPSFIITLSGTDDPECDGKRASASLYIEGDVLGHFPFDWFRHRREFRAARLACAWINDVDRAANNGLVVMRNGCAYYYLIDFNSSLGSWNGIPKEPWQGRRYRADVAWSWWRNLFPRARRDGYDPNEPVVSPAVGRFNADFDPRTWRPNLPNTAFDHITDDDAAWMTRKMADISDTQIRAVVEAATFSDPADAEYVCRTLLQRREKILRAYPPCPSSKPALPI